MGWMEQDLASWAQDRPRLVLQFVCIWCTKVPYTESAMLRIDLASNVPVYEQIANGLRAELVAGQFGPGDRLPTVRALAIDLGVHHNTVAEAYRRLADEGWLELKRHRGAMVRERHLPPDRPAGTEGFARPLRELLAKALAEGLSRRSLIRELTDSARRLKAGGL
jgi:GntR family transcriptional regulator